jgi:cytochrome c peroxidase
MISVTRLSMLLALVVLILPGSPMAADPPSRLRLAVHPLYNGAPLALDTPTYATRTGERLSFSRLSFLLSEPSVRTVAADGTETWLSAHDWHAYLDAASNRLTATLRDLPRGTYSALRFYVGPAEAVDLGDPSQYPPQHALNPVLNRLHWGWRSGYVYLAIEGHVHSREPAAGFSYHLAGATNRMMVTLPVEINLAQDRLLDVELNIDTLFAGQPALKVTEDPVTHSRDGDPLATRLKLAVETSFSVRGQSALAPDEAPVVAGGPAIGTPYKFTLPRGFPIPDLPRDNPLTEERIKAGWVLFHDPRLSSTRTQSCASCHDRAVAFTDLDRRFSLGVTGAVGTRNSMPLFNLAWKREFFWDGRAPSLRVQALQPIENPVEMHHTLDEVERTLRDDESTRELFQNAFGSPEVNRERIALALEAFMLTLTSFDSRFDRAMRGETELTEQEKQGFALFNTEFDPARSLRGADCFHCHGGAFFSDHQFHNNGLTAMTNDAGREQVTGRPGDRLKFITPSLRNIALTAPYMHDGRFQTLEEVIDHYDHRVIRTETLDPNLAKHPTYGMELTEEEKFALIAFLKSLTDPQYQGGY